MEREKKNGGGGSSCWCRPLEQEEEAGAEVIELCGPGPPPRVIRFWILGGALFELHPQDLNIIIVCPL